MAKNKTYKQKLASDKRQAKSATKISETASSEAPKHTYTFQTKTISQETTGGTTMHYVAHDLRKTVILTLSIVLGQIVLLYLMRM